jgi:vitamin B12 transporter
VLAGEQASDHCFLKVNPMFFRPTKVALACAGIFATISSVYAQTNLEPVVVIASGFEQPLSKVLPSTSVITRSDLDRTQAKTLAEALQGEAGFEFGRNGGAGTTTSLFLRGADSKNIVVMIDGVRSQTDNLGSLQLTDIPLSTVERIEILRGNAGALYGESAIGGVINIITKSGKGDPKANALVTYGSRNTSETAVGYLGEINKTKFSINASRFETDGFSSKKPGVDVNPDRDGYTNETVSGKISHHIQAGTEVGLTTQIVRGKTAFDSSAFGGLSTDNDVFRSDTNNIGFFGVTNLTNKLRSRLDIVNSKFTYKDSTNGMPIQYFGVQEGKQNTYRLSNFYELSDTQQISFGLDKTESEYDVFQYANVKNNTNLRDTRGAFIGSLKKIGALDIQANLRRDELSASYQAHRDSYGGEKYFKDKYAKNTYLLGLGYQLTPLYRVTATSSTGFRAPSPAEFSGSTNLRPETNKSNEAGVLYSTQATNMRLVYFDTHASDALYYNPNNFSYENMNVKNKGFEVSGKKMFGSTSIKASFTKQNPINTDLNLQQARRAKEFGSVDLNHQLGQYQIGGLLYWSGSRKDKDTNATTVATIMPSYTVLNLYASYRIDKEWVARLRVENAGNTNYELASGFNTPGRGAFITLQYQPK